MENKWPKVLIGIPTYNGKDYCLDEFIESIKKIDYPNKEIIFMDNSDDLMHAEIIRKKGFNTVYLKAKDYYDKIIRSRNAIRSYFLAKDFDYLFFIDSDVMVPADALQKLVKHDKDIVSGVVYTIWTLEGQTKIRPILFEYNDETTRKIMKTKSKTPGLHEIAACGAGCMLVKRKVHAKISFAMPEDKKTSEDYWFCYLAEKQGFKIYADTSVQCKHSIISNSGKNVTLQLGSDGKIIAEEKEVKKLI